LYLAELSVLLVFSLWVATLPAIVAEYFIPQNPPDAVALKLPLVSDESLFTSEVLIYIVNSISADVIANAGSGTNGNIGTLEYKV
jgi:hypothetical protein